MAFLLRCSCQLLYFMLTSPACSALLGRRPLAQLQQRTPDKYCHGFLGAENARLKPSAALMLAAAVTWMRMVSCSLAASHKLLRRSGMLQRCMHVLHTILAACPATPPVCYRSMMSAARHFCGR